VGLVFLLVLIGGGVYWLIKPETVTATALFEVRVHSPSIVGNQAGQWSPAEEYEILKNTQIAALKSKFLLASALRDPGVASLPMFATVSNPEEWLQDHLEVDFPQHGSILSIALRGPASQANDLSAIVDAVAGAYKRSFLDAERARLLSQHDMLERSLQNINSEIKRKFEDYLDIAKGMDRTEGSNEMQRQLDMKRMERIDGELAQLEREQLRIETGGDGKDSKFVSARMTQLTKRQNELLKSMQKRGEISVDLATRKEELEQLQSIARDMSMKLEQMNIDRQLPARINQIQSALIEPQQVARQ
jgi:hypothetical protein